MPYAAPDSQPVDHAALSLQHILHSGEYVRVPDTEIFTEHSIRNARGEVVRQVTRADLEQAAANGNRKAATSGDLAPVGPGHTFDDVYDESGRLVRKFPETDQPPIWGYLYRYSVRPNPHTGKFSLYADQYIKREIEAPDGRIVDGPQYAKTFPRRSPEYYPTDRLIDWLALLRRTPKLDMGLVAYAKANPDRVCYVRNTAGLTPAAFVGRTKVRYALGESEMADPTMPPTTDPTAGAAPPPPPAEMAPEEAERYSRGMFGMPAAHAHRLMNHLKQRYGRECGIEDEVPPPAPGAAPPPPERAAMASPTNGVMPPAPAGAAPEKNRMQRVQGEIEVSRYQRQYEEERAARLSLESRVAASEARERAARYERDLGHVLSQGYQFDLGEEMAAVRNVGQDVFDAHLARIKKRYQRAPIGDGTPLDPYAHELRREKKPGDPADMTEEEALECSRYMRAKEGRTWSESVEHYQKERAKA